MKLRTGTVFEFGGADDKILGISADLEVIEGFDPQNPRQWNPLADDPVYKTDDPQLTTEEKVDVCDVMIGRWQRLRERLERETASDRKAPQALGRKPRFQYEDYEGRASALAADILQHHATDLEPAITEALCYFAEVAVSQERKRRSTSG